MGSKTIALTGLAVSAALVYFCIDFKKDEIALACNVKEKIANLTEKKPETIPANEIVEVDQAAAKPAERTAAAAAAHAMTEKSEPAFGISLGDTVNVVSMFAPDEKRGALINYIEDLCQQSECLNDLRYSEDIKSSDWDQEMIALIQFFREEHIPKASIYVNSNLLHIEGELKTAAQQAHLREIEARLRQKGLQIADETKRSAAAAEEIEAVQEPEKTVSTQTAPKPETTVKAPQAKEPAVVKTPAVTEHTPPKATHKAQTAQTAAKATPQRTVPQSSAGESGEALTVTFENNSNRISAEGRQLLDRRAEQLGGDRDKGLEIDVYAQVGEDPMVNIIVAQKRADLIKRYMRKKGFTRITARGHAVTDNHEYTTIKIKR